VPSPKWRMPAETNVDAAGEVAIGLLDWRSRKSRICVPAYPTEGDPRRGSDGMENLLSLFLQSGAVGGIQMASRR